MRQHAQELRQDRFVVALGDGVENFGGAVGHGQRADDDVDDAFNQLQRQSAGLRQSVVRTGRTGRIGAVVEAYIAEREGTALEAGAIASPTSCEYGRCRYREPQ